MDIPEFVILFKMIESVGPLQGLGYLHSKGKMHRDIKVSSLTSLSFCLSLFTFSPVSFTSFHHRQKVSHVSICAVTHQSVLTSQRCKRKSSEIGQHYSDYTLTNSQRFSRRCWLWAHIQTRAWRPRLGLLSLLGSTQQALPVSSALTAGYVQRHCEWNCQKSW